jgi:hypothetical protein
MNKNELPDTPERTPNPGSDEAVKLGCTCPVEDNKHGDGVPSSIGPLFWMGKNCPLHGDEA